MKNKELSIGILSITAVILFIAQFLPVQRVQAEEALKGSNYSVATSRRQGGGETIYIIDRSGQLVILTWDAGGRRFTVAGMDNLTNVFR
jgi:hypothetical protein